MFEWITNMEEEFISSFYTETYYLSRWSIFSKASSDGIKSVVEQNLLIFKFFFQARRDQRGLQLPQILTKVDLLPIGNNSEKKTWAKKL